MRLLQYKDLNLNLRRVKAAFDKVKAAIEAGDFRSADVKKLHAGSYYRAKLDYANRLLLQFARIDRPDSEGGTETVCLALEVIENHAYERSRFLRGAVVDESRIEREPARRCQGTRTVRRGHAAALAGPGPHAVRAAGQAHRLRRRAGRGLPTPGAAGGDRLGRLGQDGGHAGAAARGRGPGALRHAVGLPGAERPRRCTPRMASRTRSRRSTSSATASCWRPCACRRAAR